MSDNVSEDYRAKFIGRAKKAIDEPSDESDSWAHTNKWLPKPLKVPARSEADDDGP